jgi:hypothetical protein
MVATVLGTGMTSLGMAFDDPADPAELTLFPTGDAWSPTCWITADVEDAVALDRMR